MTPRRAVLLAAGRGTRLGSLSATTPKCLQRVAGVPLIDHTLRHLAGSGVTEIAVNLHHLPGAVIAHCGDGSAWGVAITYSYEPDLLAASIGDLLRTPPKPDLSHIRPTVSLERRLRVLRDLLSGRGKLDFDESFGGEDKLTQAVTLFAMLELHKRGEATWEQSDVFGPIEVRAS